MPFHSLLHQNCIDCPVSCVLMSEELRECASNMSAVLEVVRGLTARIKALETPEPEDERLVMADYVAHFIMVWLVAVVCESCRNHLDDNDEE